jgi:hypothetical protein
MKNTLIQIYRKSSPVIPQGWEDRDTRIHDAIAVLMKNGLQDIAVDIAYSWMPTMLKHKGDHKRINQIISKAETKDLEICELEEFKSLVNNSIVGVSKVLALCYPDRFAIWDSRVAKALDLKSTSVSNIAVYIAYIKSIREASKEINVKIRDIESAAYLAGGANPSK